jgi:membrane protease YdiL (CAAX protease family)
MPPPKRSPFAEILRVIWRLALFGVASSGLMMAAGAVLLPVFPSGLPFGRPGQVLYYLMFAVALGLAHLAAAFWEKSGDWEILGFGADGWRPRPLGLALAAGLLIPVALASVLLVFDVARFQPMPDGSWGGYALNAFVLVALATMVDALAFRGYTFGLLERRWGAWVAVGVTSLAFMAVHSVGAPVNAANVLAILATGVFLGAVRARSQGVAGAWLAHVGLLWVQGGVLHGGIARFALESPPMYRFLLGPPWSLTGAGWGLDGGLLMGLVLVGAAWYLMRPLPFVPPPPARP